MTKIIPNGDTVIIYKTVAVGPSNPHSFMPISQRKVEEGGKIYLIAEYEGKDIVWYFNSRIHRELGPAITWGNGKQVWYYRGHRMDCSSQEEFTKLIKLKAFW